MSFSSECGKSQLGRNVVLARRGESTDLALMGRQERRNRAAESDGLQLFHKLLSSITAIQRYRDIQIYIHTYIHTGIHTHILTDRQADIQTDIDREIGRDRDQPSRLLQSLVSPPDDGQHRIHARKRTLILYTFFKFVWGTGWGVKKNSSQKEYLVQNDSYSTVRLAVSGPRTAVGTAYLKIQLLTANRVPGSCIVRYVRFSSSYILREGTCVRPHAVHPRFFRFA